MSGLTPRSPSTWAMRSSATIIQGLQERRAPLAAIFLSVGSGSSHFEPKLVTFSVRVSLVCGQQQQAEVRTRLI